MKLSVEALTVAPSPVVSGQAAGPPAAKGSGDDAFRQMLQALMGAPNKPTVPAATLQANGSADWLAALLSTLRVPGSTPDPSGEALPPIPGELAVPLTDLLAALQPMVNQSLAGLVSGDAAAGTADAAAGGQEQSDADTDDGLLELAALGAVLAALPAVQPRGDGSTAGGQEQLASTATAVTGTSPVTALPVQPENVASLGPQVAGPIGAVEAGPRPPVEGLAAVPGAHAPHPADAVPAPVTSGAGAAGLTAQAGTEPRAPVTRPANSDDATIAVAEGARREPPVQPLASPGVPSTPSPGAATEAVGRPLAGLPDVPVLHQVVRAVDVMQQGGAHEVRLQLQPPALGQLLVQVRVSGGDVSVHMLAETAQAQNVIREHLPELKAAMAAQGLQADHLAVTIGNHLSAFDMAYRQPERWEQHPQHPAAAPLDDAKDAAERAATRPAADPVHAVDYQV